MPYDKIDDIDLIKEDCCHSCKYMRVMKFPFGVKCYDKVLIDGRCTIKHPSDKTTVYEYCQGYKRNNALG